ncbi:LuxR C-terminal-related transcriptional regulator [Actinomycetota bacterium Odt1-20B]
MQHTEHPVEELCEAGAAVYARALREGRIRKDEAVQTPCLIDFGLLHPDVDDLHWLLPSSPTTVLARLMRTIETDIAQQRAQEAQLSALFQSLMAIEAHRAPAQEAPAVTVLDGFPRINGAITQAMSEATEELLTVQPGGNRSPQLLANTLAREQALLSRGCRMRTLYQHTSRHSLPVLAHYEQLDGDVEVRTLDEVTDRLIVVDRTIAFIPAHKGDTMALELRHPALVDYLVTTFERLWRLATPMYPYAAPQPTEPGGITPRQRAIATLLIEGLTDAEMATRLGMNVRTVRVHIAKLAATLGSESRAQLGYLIGESGILKQDR